MSKYQQRMRNNKWEATTQAKAATQQKQKKRVVTTSINNEFSFYFIFKRFIILSEMISLIF
jgi:hypothetical protein